LYDCEAGLFFIKERFINKNIKKLTDFNYLIDIFGNNEWQAKRIYRR